jgi:hypothetical protein
MTKGLERILFLLACGTAGCGGSPAAESPAREAARIDGVTYVGLPESPLLAACDPLGRWTLGDQPVEHWLVDPQNPRGPVQNPSEGSPKPSLFRSTTPFPQVTWESGDFEVTQLLYPAGAGFVARYHVMNHGSETRTCRLVIGRRTAQESAASTGPVQVDPKTSIVPVERPAERTTSHLAYDLKIEPGGSEFIQVTTAELGGKIPEDALDQAAQRWTGLLGPRRISLPDPSLMRAYYADRAGMALGLKGCEAAVAQTESRLVRREGQSLRLLPDLPEDWAVDTIEVRSLPTDFGPLSFSYQGAFNSRTLDLEDTCKPPDGFLISVPSGLKATVDGKPAPAVGGLVRLPPGTRRLEFDRRP